MAACCGGERRGVGGRDDENAGVLGLVAGDVEMEEQSDEEIKLEDGWSFHLGMMAPEIPFNSSTDRMNTCAENVDEGGAGTGRDARFLAFPFSCACSSLPRSNSSLTWVSFSRFRSFSMSLGMGMGTVPVIHTGPGPCNEALLCGTMALNFGAVLRITASDEGGEGDRAVDGVKSANDSVGVVNRVGAVTKESSEITGELEGSISMKYGTGARGILAVSTVDPSSERGGYESFLRDGSEEGMP
jgi:hypothetical protein